MTFSHETRDREVGHCPLSTDEWAEAQIDEAIRLAPGSRTKYLNPNLLAQKTVGSTQLLTFLSYEVLYKNQALTIIITSTPWSLA